MGVAFFALNPSEHRLAMIGAYNGHTDLGDTLGCFSLDDAGSTRRSLGWRWRIVRGA